MLSNSNTLSYVLKCEISPIVLTKVKQFCGEGFSPARFSNFSTEKILPTSETRETFSNSFQSHNKVSTFNDLANKTKFTSVDTSLRTSLSSSEAKTNFASFPSIKFNSQLFNNNSLKKKKEQFLGKKTKKIQKLKRETYFINEISINGHKLNNFPFINLDNENYKITLMNKVIDKHYFEITKNPTINYETTKSHYDNYIVNPKLLIENQVYFYENETNVKDIMIKFYSDIKYVLRLIEKNYLNKKNKIYNEKNCLLLELLIRNCNLFTEFIKKLPKSLNYYIQKGIKFININENETKENKLNEKSQFNIFICEFCNKKFINGQALGGHISQTHPKQSERYKKKIETRKKRVEERKLIIECRKQLLTQYGYNYDSLSQSKNKSLIKSVINSHKLEYKKLLLYMKKKKQYANLETI